MALPAASPAAGQTLETLNVRRATGATVLAVLRDGSPIGSTGELVLQPGDHLLALGTADQVERLGRLIGVPGGA